METPEVTPGPLDEPQDEPQEQRKPTRFDSDGNELDEQDYYCPACGRRSSYQRECTGRPDAPHPPLDVIPTDELQGDEHTAAPNTGT